MDRNQVYSYAIFDKTVVNIPRPFWQKGNTLFLATGGIKASVEELLVWYKTVMKSMVAQFESGTDSTPGSPLKNMRIISSEHSILPGSSFHEQSYGLGWARS